MRNQRPEAVRLYGSMLAAHTEALGEPDQAQKRYLWGLAQRVAEREKLSLRYGAFRPGGGEPMREGGARGFQAHFAERVHGYVGVRWESEWVREES